MIRTSLTLSPLVAPLRKIIVEHMSPRLQPRRSVKTVLNYYEDAQESEDDYRSGNGHERSAQHPRRGKVKTERSGSEAKQARRRRSGKLSKFPAMPLDVMYEVGCLMSDRAPCLRFWPSRYSRYFTPGIY